MKLHLPTPRLLPFTIAALAAVLVLKTVDLVRHAASAFDGAPAAGLVSVAHAAAEEKPQVAAPGAKAPVPARAAAPASGPVSAAASGPAQDPAGPSTISDGERAVLLDLRQRRQELDARAAALSVRESILAAADQKLSARIQELTALQTRLQDLEAARRQREEAGWQGLVKLYQDMKPRDAAAIFNDLQMPVLLGLVDRMKERNAAQILAAMNQDKARDVTTGLARLRSLREVPAAGAQKGG